MTPQQFIRKWRDSTLKERSASQSHFNDLCALLGEPTPTDVDPDGNWYTFERGAKNTGGGDGWADVWKRGCAPWLPPMAGAITRRRWRTRKSCGGG